MRAFSASSSSSSTPESASSAGKLLLPASAGRPGCRCGRDHRLRRGLPSDPGCVQPASNRKNASLIRSSCSFSRTFSRLPAVVRRAAKPRSRAFGIGQLGLQLADVIVLLRQARRPAVAICGSSAARACAAVRFGQQRAAGQILAAPRQRQLGLALPIVFLALQRFHTCVPIRAARRCVRTAELRTSTSVSSIS